MIINRTPRAVNNLKSLIIIALFITPITLNRYLPIAFVAILFYPVDYVTLTKESLFPARRK